MNTQQDFELTEQDIDEFKRLLQSTIGNGSYYSDFLQQTDPKKIKQYLPKITQLSFQPRKSLVTLPDSIKYLNNLEKLEFDYSLVAGDATKHEQNILSNLSVLFEHIGELNQLRSLSMTDHQITRLPENIWQLQSLQTLHLGGRILSNCLTASDN